MLLKEAENAIGSYSRGNLKMNCGCWGLPTSTCRKQSPDNPESTCHKKNCYAQRNQYLFPNVIKAQAKRLGSTRNPDFIQGLSTIFRKHEYFRMFDSGDFWSRNAIHDVMTAAAHAEDTKVYIPTKKYDDLEYYLSHGGEIPSNVTLRPGIWLIEPPISMIDDFCELWGRTSIVTHEPESYEKELKPYFSAHWCKAPHDEKCILECTACWDRKLEVAIYPWH